MDPEPRVVGFGKKLKHILVTNVKAASVFQSIHPVPESESW